MLDMYEQKVLIEYLINAVEFMKKDADCTFCTKKVLDLIEAVNESYKTKEISFDLKENIDYESIKHPKKLYYAVADDVISQLKKQLGKLNVKKISSWEKIFRHLQNIFVLTDDEMAVFKMFCRNELDQVICDILCLAQRRNGHCSVQSMCYHYLNSKRPLKILLKLVDVGLLNEHRGRRGFRYSIPSSIEIVFESNYSTMRQIYNHLVGNVLKANLKKDDFKHLSDEFETVERILKNAIERKTKGINILFYGEVGAGKTEMAKTIANCLKIPMFEVISEDESEEEVDRDVRIGDLKSKQRILSPMNGKQIILFDEAEDIFKDTLFNSKTQSKAFVNKILENNEIPVIWTTNDVENMDKAYLRRFIYSVKFDKLNEDIQLKFMKKEFKKHNFKISDEEIAVLSKKYDLTSATITNAINVLKLTDSPNEDFEKYVINQMTLLNRGTEAGENFKANKKSDNYNFDLINTDSNIEDLAKRIKATGKFNFSLCLYGEAGTGKSEYAKQLAGILGLDVVFKRASDLMSKWVGETEKNIAQAFKEARDKKAILIFDEADSFLYSRESSSKSWEITQVNEMLTWMETHPYPFICTTNFMDTLDEASLRRFTFKIKFKYMTAKQVQLGFKHFFNKEVPIELANIKGLTAGDFATVKKKIVFLGTDDVYELKHMLEEEVKVKKSKELSSTVGF